MKGGSGGDTSVLPAKAGIQTWPHMLRPWIPAFAGIDGGTAPPTFYIFPSIL